MNQNPTELVEWAEWFYNNVQNPNDFRWKHIHNMAKAIKQLQEDVKTIQLVEREACAQVCEARYMGDNNREDMEAKRCAAAIRERSK